MIYDYGLGQCRFYKCIIYRYRSWTRIVNNSKKLNLNENAKGIHQSSVRMEYYGSR